jgi:hypothetical protein
MGTSHLIETGFQSLPSAGTAREALREKGQFWTPPWLAKVMAAWVTEQQPEELFDPAVGPGTFFSAARAVGYTGRFDGFELHETAFEDGEKLGLTAHDFSRIQIGDFISSRLTRTFPAVISNPPYIRHHRLGDERKSGLRTISERVLGFALDGRGRAARLFSAEMSGASVPVRPPRLPAPRGCLRRRFLQRSLESLV